MSVIQARVSGEESELIMQYVKAKKISVSDLIREAVLEKIEDEIDLKLYEEAMAEYKNNPLTYTFDDIKKDLGIDSEL